MLRLTYGKKNYSIFPLLTPTESNREFKLYHSYVSKCTTYNDLQMLYFTVTVSACYVLQFSNRNFGSISNKFVVMLSTYIVI